MKTANDGELTDAHTEHRDQGGNVSLEEVKSAFHEIRQLCGRNFLQWITRLELCEFDPIPPTDPRADAKQT